VFSLLAPVAVYGQTRSRAVQIVPKLPDGNWSVAKPIKIEHGNASEILICPISLASGLRHVV
jgi:hypothetical protein